MPPKKKRNQRVNKKNEPTSEEMEPNSSNDNEEEKIVPKSRAKGKNTANSFSPTNYLR